MLEQGAIEQDPAPMAGLLSLVGIVVGAIVGSRLAPQLLTGGSNSAYTPLAALAGAAFGALLFETLGAPAGRTVRGVLVIPPLYWKMSDARKRECGVGSLGQNPIWRFLMYG